MIRTVEKGMQMLPSKFGALMGYILVEIDFGMLIRCTVVSGNDIIKIISGILLL